MSRELVSRAQIKNGVLSLDDNDRFHILKAEIFTGDDDYKETDCITAVNDPTNRTKLWVDRRVFPEERPSRSRIRFEPGVRLTLLDESNGNELTLTIAHHKGTVEVSLKAETLNAYDANRLDV